MANTKKAVHEGPAAAEPTTAAEFEKRAIVENQANTFKMGRAGVPTTILPGGIREDATRYIQVRYRNKSQSNFLSNPESIIREDWLAAHPNWRYMWPVRGKYDTDAQINAGRYTPVPFEAIDRTKRDAMVAPDPTGKTVWMQHVLVAVPPEVWHEDMIEPEYEAKARTAQTRAQMENEINRNFKGFTAEWDPLDVRKER